MACVVLATAVVDDITVLPETHENARVALIVCFVLISVINNYDTLDSIKRLQDFLQEKVFYTFYLSINLCSIQLSCEFPNIKFGRKSPVRNCPLPCLTKKYFKIREN